MDFLKILRSAEEALYEVMMWLLLYPRTIWLILRHPGQLHAKVSEELTQADDLRRWITSEVHDELGQNLTALQMQVKLAESASGQPGLFASMREIIGHMRASVSVLLGSLRPAGLDEFGLHRTLDEGAAAFRDLDRGRSAAAKIVLRPH